VTLMYFTSRITTIDICNSMQTPSCTLYSCFIYKR